MTLRFFSRFVPLAALALLGAWPGQVRAQLNPTGFKLMGNTSISSDPNKYSGAIVVNTSVGPFTVGGGTVATDNHMVHSSVRISVTDLTATNPITNRNFFVLQYNEIATPTSAMGVPLKGPLYNQNFTTLAKRGGTGNIGALVFSYGVYYAAQDLISGVVPSISVASPSTFGLGATKIINEYAGFFDYRLYTSGPITSDVISSNTTGQTSFFIVPTVVPLLYPTPAAGGAFWIKTAGSWSLGAIALGAGTVNVTDSSNVTTSYFGGDFLWAGAGGPVINAALLIVANLTRGAPTPRLNTSAVFRSVVEGKDATTFNVQAKNGGSGALEVDVTKNVPWLSVVPKHAVIKQNKLVLQLFFKTKNLAVGVYQGQVVVASRHEAKSVNVTLRVTADKPSAPRGVKATSNQSDGIQVTWRGSNDAVSYEVYRGGSAKSTAGLKLVGTPSKASFFDDTAVSGKTYYYFVRTVGPTYRSGYSSPGARGKVG